MTSTDDRAMLARPGVRAATGHFLLAPALLVLFFYLAALVYLLQASFYTFIRPDQLGEASLVHYIKALTDSLYLGSLLSTFRLSLVATVIALLIGYPIAYRIVRTQSATVRAALIIAVAIPFLTNVIVRLYSLSLALGNTGLVNETLRGIGYLEGNDVIRMMRTELGVGIGLVYFVLPFVVFTLTSALRRLDRDFEEAAESLGASKTETFVLVTLPLSLPGIVGAAALSFILCIPAFSTPLILGEGAVRMIANHIYDQILFVENTPFGAALAVITLVITVVFLFAQTALTRKRYRV